MNIRCLVFPLLLCLHFVAFATPINLQLPKLNETQVPIPPTLSNKQLGTAVTLSGSTAAISALPDNTVGTGSVYIYDANKSWQLTAELNSLQDADDFARQIILQDNKLIVSAERDDSLGVDSGAVYIFEFNAKKWQQITKITASDGLAGDRFGHAIALVDNILYIGAPFHQQGKVYIYSQNTADTDWQFNQSIEPTDAQALRFGAGIAKDQNTLIIGAPYTDAPENQARMLTNKNRRFAISKGDIIDPGIQSGAVFAYKQGNGVWQQTARIGSSIRETGDHLGEKIAINGYIIVASIKHKDVWDDLRAGTVLIYRKVAEKWEEEIALTADIPQLGGSFGSSFSMLDNHILIGGSKMHSNGFNSGKAYLFNQKIDRSWQLIHQQTNASNKAHDQFGLKVSLGEEAILVASKNSVYSFQNRPLTYNPAIYYAEQQLLQLDEVDVSGLGVFSATLQFSQQADDMLLTVVDTHRLNNKKFSQIKYSTNTGELIIPALALQQNNQQTFYTVTLKQVKNTEQLMFKVTSIESL